MADFFFFINASSIIVAKYNIYLYLGSRIEHIEVHLCLARTIL